MIKTLSNFNFKDKVVILRCDLNSDLISKKIILSQRIIESVKTIKELKKAGAKIVIISHQGRPKKKDYSSLKQHAKLLSKFTKVDFINDIIERKAINKIKTLKSGQAILLENIRSLDDEFNIDKKNNRIIKNLVPLADIYVNDAFSVSHRKHTSVVGFAKHLPSCIGRVFENEINALKKIKLDNCLQILGGAKPEDNIKLIKKGSVIATALFDSICLIAKGYKLGDQENAVKDGLKLIPKIKKHNKNISTSVDFLIEDGKSSKAIELKDLPVKKRLYDIGPRTIKNHIEKIKKAKCIFVKGPAGFYQDKRFTKGTEELLKAVAKNKGYKVLGGGNLNAFLKLKKINEKNFNHISLAGGALISYLAGEKLPGIEVLKIK